MSRSFLEIAIGAVALGLLLFTLICLMSSGHQRSTFSDQADQLCKAVDSSIAYSNPSKKVVICD